MPSDEPAIESKKRIAIAIDMDNPYPWHHGCYQGILKYAEEQGDWLCIVDPFLVGMSPDSNSAKYDAVVGRIDFTTAELAKAHNLPVVNHWSNSPVTGLPSVLSDEIEMGRMVGEHLIACGYRRFAFAGIRDNRPGNKQLEGFTQAVTSKGFKPPKIWLAANEFEENREELSRFRRELLAWLTDLDTPVGIAAINATPARYIAQGCYELGMEVPKDVGIVVQSSDYSSDSGKPSITSIERDFIQLGYDAANLLDDLMHDRATHPLQRTQSPTRLIQRDSTDIFVCDDPLVKEAMRYIAEHCRETLTVQGIADAVYTSKSTLRRRFVEVLGRQVKDEIARLRTEYVKSLLIETDKPLATIADECGYSSPTQFARYFTNTVGRTPSAFRKQFQVNQAE